MPNKPSDYFLGISIFKDFNKKVLMKLIFKPLLVLFLLFASTAPAQAQEQEYDVKQHYKKQEFEIPMRDGVLLHTTVYSPKDTSREYPILMTRTPYSSRPYGVCQSRTAFRHNFMEMSQAY